MLKVKFGSIKDLNEFKDELANLMDYLHTWPESIHEMGCYTDDGKLIIKRDKFDYNTGESHGIDNVFEIEYEIEP